MQRQSHILISVTAWFALAQAMPALASSITFDIPRQRADLALTRFAQQSGVPVLFPYDQVEQLTANALSGEFPINEGLKILLAGTGLEATVQEDDQITVRVRSGALVGRGAGRSAATGIRSAATALRSAQLVGIQLDEVLVTGSRIERLDGMVTPTPLTSLTAHELQQMSPATVTAALRQLPQFVNSQAPENSGVSWSGHSGASILNLRGVGTNRTLVLLDGRRLVSSTRRGTVDISLLPEALLGRVDVMTGGASAAYGSDAVSGVVNLILDTDYTGFRANVQGGRTDAGDNDNFKLSLAAGRDAGARGHVVLAADFYRSEAIRTPTSRDWFKSWGIIANPGEEPPDAVIVPNVRSRQFTFGGLILDGPENFRFRHFQPDGSLTAFRDGEYPGPTAQSGGDGVDLGALGYVLPEVERGSLLLHGKVNLHEDAQLFGQLIYGISTAGFNSPPSGAQYGSWAATIYNDNAFLSPTLRDEMAQAGITQFRLGRSGDLDYGAGKYVEQDTHMLSLTSGIKGQLGGDWRYNAYYQYGQSESTISVFNMLRLDRVYRAIDAVIDPSSGEPVCRSTLSFPGDGCVPMNVFGLGSPSAAAMAYVNTPRVEQAQLIKQHVVDAALQGQPLRTWAGPVTVAAGASYRREWFDQEVLPGDLHAVDMPASAAEAGYQGLPAPYLGSANIFERGPANDPNGSYDVWEAFAEASAPLAIEQPFAHLLEANGAVRYANYQGSGGIVAWKAGLLWQLFSDLRLRATMSRDVRAGSLSERFDTTRGPGSAIDPFKDTGVRDLFTAVAGGNPHIGPEKANTLTAGITYQPSWFPGFGMSIDFYDIDIRDAISQLTVQNILDECYAGDAQLCALVERDSLGDIATVHNVFINIAQARTRGIEMEFAYENRISLFGGQEGLRVRAFGSYAAEQSTVAQRGAQRIDRAGQTGLTGGVPHWQAYLSLTYLNGPLSVSLHERYIDAGSHSATATAQDFNDNTIDKVLYTNLAMEYGWRGPGRIGYSLYATVTNLFDRAPPVAPVNGFSGTVHSNPFLFDMIGRRYVVGLTLKF